MFRRLMCPYFFYLITVIEMTVNESILEICPLIKNAVKHKI